LSQVEGAQLPPGGPQPPPASISAAIANSKLSTDTYTQSQAVSAQTGVVAQNTTNDTNYVLQFEQSEAPPPYTLASAAPHPARDNSRALAPAQFSTFQIRQFSDLVKTIRSITSSVLPNFSFSA